MTLFRPPPSRRAGRGATILAAALLGSCAAPPPPPPPQAGSPAILPDFLKDPAEPLNRGIFAFNRGVLEGVVDPAAQVYQTIVPKRVRTSINHFTHNMMFPGRLVNEALQGRWEDAGDDSLRFLTNTTAGVAGLFDVATRWDIAKPRADFGQTFQAWGWKPRNYVMLPVLGPSDETNAVGTVFDEAAEIWNYTPYSRRISYATTFNRITEPSGELVRAIRSEADPYSVSKLAWSYLSKNDSPDWTVRGPRDIPTLETIAVASIRLQDPEFTRRGRQMSVHIPSTGRRLPVNCWLQDGKAPLVYVTPGLGSHRLSMTTLSVAETLYQHGCSVVTTSSVFHPEFMERAATSVLPGFVPTDAADLLAALGAVDQTLATKHPGRFGDRALVGCSMGGFHTLYLAARQPRQNPAMPHFARFVAINPPVDLHHGISQVDSFHNAPLAWPAAERQQRVNNAVHKVGGLTDIHPSAMEAPPFDAIESKYLIGLTFRFTLRDIIFSSHSRHNLGLLPTPLPKWRREPAYDAILGVSYHEYAARLLFPHYLTRGVGHAEFKQASNLRNFGRELRNQTGASVITNRNDFLLEGDDLPWLKSVLGSSRLTVFPHGGHLGNLAGDDVRQALIRHLGDLQSCSSGRSSTITPQP